MHLASVLVLLEDATATHFACTCSRLCCPADTFTILVVAVTTLPNGANAEPSNKTAQSFIGVASQSHNIVAMQIDGDETENNKKDLGRWNMESDGGGVTSASRWTRSRRLQLNICRFPVQGRLEAPSPLSNLASAAGRTAVLQHAARRRRTPRLSSPRPLPHRHALFWPQKCSQPLPCRACTKSDAPSGGGRAVGMLRAPGLC